MNVTSLNLSDNLGLCSSAVLFLADLMNLVYKELTSLKSFDLSVADCFWQMLQDCVRFPYLLSVSLTLSSVCSVSRSADSTRYSPASSNLCTWSLSIETSCCRPRFCCYRRWNKVIKICLRFSWFSYLWCTWRAVLNAKERLFNV